MKVLAKVKMPKTSQRDFLVAHRYTICDGMCALRGVLQTAVACRRQSKGNTAFSLRCRGRTYPFAYFAFSEAPKSGAALPTKSADGELYEMDVGRCFQKAVKDFQSHYMSLWDGIKTASINCEGSFVVLQMNR